MMARECFDALWPQGGEWKPRLEVSDVIDLLWRREAFRREAEKTL